ncbi:ATP-dependent metallopeptidase Hfl [Dentipellis sp. KUC8613]|nr:ATP-dependent metallopeptidase Hfl [Dentipellis sp. KUC8613]
MLPVFGIVRHQAHVSRPSALIPRLARSFSRLPPTTPSSLLFRTPLRPIPALPSCHNRFFSLRSLFFASPTPPTPPPHAVASIARLEAEADENPNDVSKQLELFAALADSKHKAGYGVIIARWERMCEFDPASPLLKSDKAFEYYLNALISTGAEPSINPAVRQRESLLAQHPAAAAASAIPAAHASETTSSATSETTSSATSETASASSETSSASAQASSAEPTPAPQPSEPPVSRSQEVAQAVLAGRSVEPVGAQPLSPDMARLASALASGAGVSGNPIHVTINEPKGAWIPRFARFVVFMVIGGFLVLSLLAYMLENTGLVKAGPRQAEFEPHQGGNPVKFSDVHGVDEAKEELKDVVEFLKDPTVFAALGGKLPKGVLLTGSPGTGKTMLARAVAGEAGVPFLFASGSEFEEMFVGVGAKRVRDLFAAARAKQPAIIFIDELDAIGGKRNARDQQYMKQTLNQLLVEMDGFLQTEGVIVIAATNFPESLDEALVRPGRFDRHIAVPLPDIRGRAQILQHHMRDIVVSKEVDPMVLARGTPGFSGADLQNMVNQAAIQASKEKAKEVNLKHLEWAKDRIVMGAERKSQFIDEKVKKLTAYHEGGHALAALYTEGAMPLHKVTCVPRGHALGVTSMLPKDDRLSVSLKEYLASIDVSLGGRVAEELIFGPENVTSGASSDLRAATSVATKMVKYWGYSDKIGPVFLNEREEPVSAHKREEIETEVRNLLQAGQVRVAALLKSKLGELHRLAEALLEHETLDMEEVKKVIKGEPIRNINEVIREDLAQMPAPAPASPAPGAAHAAPATP